MPSKSRINYQVLRREINKIVAEDNNVLRLATNEITPKFEIIKRKLIENFENHPVTKELKQGAYSSNETNSIAGNGNLFSFIGFNQGYDPTDPIRILLESLNIYPPLKAKYSGVKKIRFEFRADIPTYNEIQDITPMPQRWSSGSWVRRIETAIFGIQHYLYYEDLKKAKPFGSYSASGTGIQIKGNLRKEYRPIKYIKELIAKYNVELLGRLST